MDNCTYITANTIAQSLTAVPTVTTFQAEPLTQKSVYKPQPREGHIGLESSKSMQRDAEGAGTGREIWGGDFLG